MSLSIEYKIPSGGAATDFTDAERPINYAKAFVNRFININGRAERRAGCRVLGTVSGGPELTQLHEWVSDLGSATLMASDNSGNLYRYNGSASVQLIKSGMAATRLLSVQANEKLIFYNGVDRDFYTADGGNTFYELLALINQGTLAAGSNTTTVVDSLVSAWATQTYIANNDIIYNTTVSAFGIVTNVSGNTVNHTTIGTAGQGIGLAATNQTVGQTYKIIDGVDLNIIRLDDGTYDNVAVAGAGTTTNVIAVSGTNFQNTQIRPGDFIYNTTRAALTSVVTVSANINTKGTITGQTSGDSLVFFKSAMPISSFIHVHYGRVYHIDSREKTKVRISAPDDPQDMTTFAKTLDSSSFNFGSQQSRGDQLLALGTFQNYFIAVGQRNIYVFSGINPIKDNTNDVISFAPLAVFPDGGVSRFGVATNGNDGIYMSPNGLQAINVGTESFINPRQTNLSAQNSDDFRNRIEINDADDIQIYFYSKKQWVLCKLGDILWVFNVAPILTDSGDLAPKGSWTLFSGLFAEMNHYMVRADGVLYGCGAGGNIYIMEDGDNTDAGQVIETKLTTARYFLEEPQRTNRIKRGYYIRPLFESFGNIPYSIQATGGWDNISNDSVVVTAAGGVTIENFQVGVSQIGGGQVIQAEKRPLRWRGENVEFTFQTATSAGPDIISSYTVYGEISGRR